MLLPYYKFAALSPDAKYYKSHYTTIFSLCEVLFSILFKNFER